MSNYYDDSLCFVLQILCEFDRTTNRNCMERFNRFWTPEHIQKVQEMEGKKKAAKDLIRQVGVISNVELGRKYVCLIEKG